MTEALSAEAFPAFGVASRSPQVLARPAPVQLSRHLFLVGGERVSHPYDASAYLVTGPNPVLVDCGSVLGWPAVRANIVSAGVPLERLTAVLATHCHFDHASGHAELAAECAVPLLMHPADAPAAAAGDNDRTAAFLYGVDAPPLRVAGPLPEVHRSGPVTVTTIHTPGHTAGSCCFVVHDGDMRVLLAADTLFGGFHPRIGSDLAAWEASLATLAGAEFDHLSVGHAHPPLLGDAKRVLAEARLQLGVYFNPWFRSFHLDFQR